MEISKKVVRVNELKHMQILQKKYIGLIILYLNDVHVLKKKDFTHIFLQTTCNFKCLFLSSTSQNFQ